MGDAIATFRFDKGGVDRRWLVSGWSTPETGFTWSKATLCSLSLPAPLRPCDLVLVIELQAFSSPPTCPPQHILLTVNGRFLCAETVTGEGVLAYGLTREQAGSPSQLDLDFLCPGAASPYELGLGEDRRKLGIALRRIRVFECLESDHFHPITRSPLKTSFCAGNPNSPTDLDLPSLAGRFESLGLNCEFGLFQRRCRAEPLGLLRFAGLSYNNLLLGLSDGFDRLSDDQALYAHLDDKKSEWMLSHTWYGLTYHTFLPPNAIDAVTLVEQQRRQLQFRRDKLLDALRCGEKLFVIKRPEGMSPAETAGLLAMLRCYGPAALLFIDSGSLLEAGSVAALAPGLFCGSLRGVEIIANEEELIGRDTWLSDQGVAAWVSLCANAYLLWDQGRQPAPE